MFTHKKILVPTDFSDYSILALKQALAISSQFGSHLHVLHVLRKDLFGNKPLFFLDDDKIQELRDKLAENAEQDLQKLLDEHTKDHSFEITTEVRFGSPHHEILNAEKETGADLIVISSRGLNAIEGFFYGSTTEKVVRRATCSVLVTRRLIDES